MEISKRDNSRNCWCCCNSSGSMAKVVGVKQLVHNIGSWDIELSVAKSAPLAKSTSTAENASNINWLVSNSRAFLAVLSIDWLTSNGIHLFVSFLWTFSIVIDWWNKVRIFDCIIVVGGTVQCTFFQSIYFMINKMTSNYDVLIHFSCFRTCGGPVCCSMLNKPIIISFSFSRLHLSKMALNNLHIRWKDK